MGNMGSLNGWIPGRQVKCQNCKQDVTLGSVAEKIKCPRCGCGVFLDLSNPRMGQPTQDPKQYTEGAGQHGDFSTIRPQVGGSS